MSNKSMSHWSLAGLFMACISLTSACDGGTSPTTTGDGGSSSQNCSAVSCSESVCGIFVDACQESTDCSCMYAREPDSALLLGRPFDGWGTPGGDIVLISGDAGSNVFVSERKGGVWSGTAVGTDSSNSNPNFVRAARAPNGDLWAVSGAFPDPAIVRVRANGVWTEEPIDPAYNGDIALFADGTPVVVGLTVLGLVRMDKMGASWTTTMLVDQSNNPRRLAAVVVKDELWIAWVGMDSTLRIIRPDGTTDELGPSNDFDPSFIVDPSGNPLVAYAYGSDIHRAYFDGVWHDEVAVSFEGGMREVSAAFSGDGALHIAWHDTREGVHIADLADGRWFLQPVLNHCTDNGTMFLLGLDSAPALAYSCDFGRGLVERTGRYPVGSMAACREMAKSTLDAACTCTAASGIGKQCCISFAAPMNSGTVCGVDYNEGHFCGDATRPQEERDACINSMSNNTCVDGYLTLTPECALLYSSH